MYLSVSQGDVNVASTNETDPVSRSSGGNHGYQVARSVVDINHLSSSAAGLCENQPNLTAICSIGIAAFILMFFG
jgi:hypothetical protein